MDATTVKKPVAVPIAQLLLGMRGMLPNDGIETLTAKKKPRTTIQTLTTVKPLRPMTLAELRAEIQALQPNSPRRGTQNMSSRKKAWNSSVKVDSKKKSCTADGQMKLNPVRKVLNFQPKPKPVSNSRTTMYTSATPKFTKPEPKFKKSLYVPANNVRFSGICSIPQTPAETSQLVKKRTTVADHGNYSHDKENNPNHANLNKALKPPLIPKIVVDTPTNMSWKSGSDHSFLQKEKEIHDAENRAQQIYEENTLENIAEISPPVSTPFKEYRSAHEYFNNSSILEGSALCDDNTIMCFDKPANCKENDKREESVIVKLCDLFNKAAVTDPKKDLKENTELEHLLQLKEKIEDSIKLSDLGIQMFTGIKETQLKELQHLNRLIETNRNGKVFLESSDKDETLVEVCKDTIEVADNLELTPKKSPILGIPCSDLEVTPKKSSILGIPCSDLEVTPKKSPILGIPCSVIKSPLRSPSYKIRRKSICLRKNLVCKLKPNISSALQTPVKNIDGEALSMYMAMKKQMNFLNTPMVNRDMQVPDTPAVTSHNLQKQLDELYRK